jgi:integrase
MPPSLRYSSMNRVRSANVGNDRACPSGSQSTISGTRPACRLHHAAPRDPRRHGKPVTRKLLFTVNGDLVERNVFNWWWQKAWKAAGVPDRGPRLNGCHVLRHTAASAWLSGGMNIAKVAALLGDTKEVVVRTYAHFMPEDDDQARVIMRRFFAGELKAPEATLEQTRVIG